MKNLKVAMGLSLATIFATAFAQASVTDIKCKTDKVVEGKTKTTFSFSVENIERPKQVGYFANNELEEMGEPVTMVPAESSLMLNENYGIALTAKGLELSSDGDGCQFTTVLLYSSKGFKKGYARVTDGGCGAQPFYTPVTCIVKAR